MAKKQSEFYTGGQKKKRNLALVPTVIIIFVLTVVVVLFYATQKYAVISEDGVRVELPILGGSEVITSTSKNSGTMESTGSYEEVTASIQVEAPDYSSVEATAGENVKPVRGIFVAYNDINTEKVTEYADRLKTGNSLMLEVKTPQGYLQWYSETPIAYSYGLNMNSPESTATLKSIVQMCKDRGIYMVAKIYVCRDDTFATHIPGSILTDQWGGGLYDENGYYLDPYNQQVRDYTVGLVKELWAMGFDEVALDSVIHPVVENSSDENGITVKYTRSMSSTPSPIGAVCGFAVNVCRQLEDRENGKFLSIYVNGPTSLVRADAQTGQDGRFFMKIFDRVYYDTDMYAYKYNRDDIAPGVTIGNVNDRFVPVVLNYLPDNTSWILVDYDEED